MYIWRLIKKIVNYLYLKYYGVETSFGDVELNGFPFILKHKTARIIIGKGVTLNSSFKSNFAGINHRIILAAPADGASITIGKGSGISGSSIVAIKEIILEDGVGLGVNACVYDTDFHPVEAASRCQQKNIMDAMAKPVLIKEGALVGANSIVLKGVTIGRFTVIGAGSIVVRSIPDNVVAAGNPAQVIKLINR